MHKIYLVNLDGTFEFTEKEKKYIRQYINKLTIIANLVLSKKL